MNDYTVFFSLSQTPLRGHARLPSRLQSLADLDEISRVQGRF